MCKLWDSFFTQPGRSLAFLLFVDRAVFILPLIVIIYFGWLPEKDWMMVLFFAGAMGLFISTTSRRYGLCIALDYLSRFFWGDHDEMVSGSEGSVGSFGSGGSDESIGSFGSGGSVGS